MNTSLKLTTALVASLALVVPTSLPAQETQDKDGKVVDCPEGVEQPCDALNDAVNGVLNGDGEKATTEEAAPDASGDAAAEGDAQAPAADATTGGDAAATSEEQAPAAETSATGDAATATGDAATTTEGTAKATSDSGTAAEGTAGTTTETTTEGTGTAAGTTAESGTTATTTEGTGTAAGATAESGTTATTTEGTGTAAETTSDTGAAPKAAEGTGDATATEGAAAGSDAQATEQPATEGATAAGTAETGGQAGEQTSAEGTSKATEGTATEGTTATETQATGETAGGTADQTATGGAKTDAQTAEQPATEGTATEGASADSSTKATGDQSSGQTAEGTKAESDAAEEANADTAAASALQALKAAITGESDAKAEDVQTETVTDQNSRSSDEEFKTKLSAEADASAEKKDDGGHISDLEKALMVGIGAVAVGSLLKGNQKVVSKSDDRVVVSRSDGTYEVIKDDNALLRQPGNDIKTETFSDGSTRTTVTRDDGSQIVTIRDPQLRVVRRVRVTPEGQQVLLIDDTAETQPVDVATLPKPETQTVEIANTDNNEDSLRRALAQQVGYERHFSLSQVRDIQQVRALAPAIDLNNVTFETGSAAIQPNQAEELASLGKTITDIIADNPQEVFLVEGHTDAVGDAAYNLALSDRRAESVALALTEYFDVPPENLVVQGYGEQFLKVQSDSAERANRRATVRRITPLLQTASLK